MRRQSVLTTVLSVLAVTLVVVMASHAGASSHEYRIRIFDQQTLQPLASTSVKAGDEGKSFVSDSVGLVVVPIDTATRISLHISHVGYRSRRAELAVGTTTQPLLIYLEPRAILLSPLMVEGTASKRQRREDGVVHQLQGRQLARQLKQTLAATLADETGLAMRSMGPAPARPVLRGLGADRVLITEDGAKSVDLSATSPDHAVTVEPFAIKQIEVLRGPQALKHSPTTLGGVVKVARGEIPSYPSSTVQGEIGLFAETASKGGLGSVNLEGGFDNLSAAGEITRRATEDVRTPHGRIANTDARSTDAGMGASLHSGRSGVGAGFHLFDLKYGIPGGFVGAHPNGVRIDMLKRRHSAQAWVAVDRAGVDSIRLHAVRTYYRHMEFEAAGVIGSEFRIVDYLARMNIYHRGLGPFGAGSAGLSVEHRDFDIGGLVFTPPSVSRTAAAFMHESGNWAGWRIDLAVRGDYSEVDPEQEIPDASIGHIRSRRFATLSASGSVFRAMCGSLQAGLVLSRSARHPTVEELFSRGPHLAAYSYEVGNPDLNAETGWGAEAILRYENNITEAALNVFTYDLEDYIIPRNTGDTNYQTFLPVYASQGVPARLSGFELRSEVRVTQHWRLMGSTGYTHGLMSNSDRPLPMVPPLKGILGIEYRRSPWFVTQECDWAAGQDRVDQFEQPTAGYAVLNAIIQYQRPSGDLVHSVTVAVDNMLDQEYRNHLSRIKSVFPESGRGIRVTYRLYF